MFNIFTFKSLAVVASIAAVATFAAAEPALAKKQKIPGHWERGQDGGFEWVGKKSKRPMGAEPVVRDHRNGASGGGVTVTSTSDGPIVRDHRNNQPVVRDHRNEPVVRDHRKKKPMSF